LEWDKTACRFVFSYWTWTWTWTCLFWRGLGLGLGLTRLRWAWTWTWTWLLPDLSQVCFLDSFVLKVDGCVSISQLGLLHDMIKTENCW